MNFASSDMRSGDHGGSQVSSMSTSSTPGTSRAMRLMSSWIIGPAGQPIDVRLCVTFTRGPYTSTSYRRPSSTMSIPSSGSSTWRSASKTSSFVGISFECSDGPNGDVRCQTDDVSLIAEEADFLAPLAGEEVDPVDEAHPIAARAHDERVRARRVGQEPHPAEQIAVRHTGRDHDHLARGELLRREHPRRVLDAGL